MVRVNFIINIRGVEMKKDIVTGDVTGFRERKRLLVLGLPFTFTVYDIQEDKLTIQQGFLNQSTDDCYMYKIQDTRLTRGLIERMFGLGTVVCSTGDITHPTLVLKHIKHSKEINDYLFKQSEESRLKRRTVNMLDIGADSIETD